MTRIILACLLALALIPVVQAKSGRPRQAQLAGALPRAANDPTVGRRLRTETAAAQATFEPGSLRLLNGRRLPVLGLRYHADQRLVEVLDSVQPDSTYLWPLSRLRGFDLGPDDLPPLPAATLGGPVGPAGPRRLRARLVREHHQAARREVVEILTCSDAGPLVLAQLAGPTAGEAPRLFVAGEGNDRNEPLRPLELTRDAVLHLCGARAVQVRAYAMTYDLHFEQATEVARMLDYFNHLAVTVNE